MLTRLVYFCGFVTAASLLVGFLFDVTPESGLWLIAGVCAPATLAWCAPEIARMWRSWRAEA